MINDVLKYRFEWKFIEPECDTLEAYITSEEAFCLREKLPPGFSIRGNTIQYKADNNKEPMYKFLCSRYLRGDDRFRENISKYDFPVFIELRHNTTIMWLFKPEGILTLPIPYEFYSFDFPDNTNIFRVR